AYFRTLFPVRRYLLPPDSSNVNEPDAPGLSLTQPTSSTGVCAVGEDFGADCAAITPTSTKQDKSARAETFTMFPPRATRTAHCTATMWRWRVSRSMSCSA